MPTSEAPRRPNYKQYNTKCDAYDIKHGTRFLHMEEQNMKKMLYTVNMQFNERELGSEFKGRNREITTIKHLAAASSNHHNHGL